MPSDYLRCFISIILSVDTLIYGSPLKIPQQIAQVPTDTGTQLQWGLDLTKPSGPLDVDMKTPIKAIEEKRVVNYNGLKDESLEPGVAEKRLIEGNGDSTSNHQKQMTMPEVKAMEYSAKSVHFPSESTQNKQAPLELNPVGSVGPSTVSLPALTINDSAQPKTLQAVQNAMVPSSHSVTESIEARIESKSETTEAEHKSAKLVRVHDTFDVVKDHQPINSKLTDLNPGNNIANQDINPSAKLLKTNPVPMAADMVDEVLNDRKLTAAPTLAPENANRAIVSDKTKEVLTTPTIEMPEAPIKVGGNPDTQIEKPRVSTQISAGSKESDENNSEKPPLDKLLHSKKQIDKSLIGVGDWKPFTLNHELIGFKGLSDSVILNNNGIKFGHPQAHQSGMDGVALEYMLMVLCVVLIIILLVWRRFWYTICTTCFPRSNPTESPSVAYKVGYRPLINRSQ